MAKSKQRPSKNKTPKKNAPASGMVAKATSSAAQARSGAMIPGKSFSSAKKGGSSVSAPRKAS